jgi:signal transduction histidine kinase
VTLWVQDNGHGFELDEAFKKGGLGLISAEERARVVNGKLTIQSELNKGTKITAFVPFDG